MVIYQMKKYTAMDSILSFPRYGKYTDLIVQFVENLGIEVLPPPPITNKTIELGTKYSPGDVCYPFKVTLGTLIEAIEQGANKIVMINSSGWCVLRCYSVAQELIIKKIGYDFDMININIKSPFSIYIGVRRVIRESGLSISTSKFFKSSKSFIERMRKIDAEEKEANKISTIRVGIVGEVYVCNEDIINMDLVRKLHEMGVYVDRGLSLSNNFFLLWREFLGINHFQRYKRLAWKYFPERVGGHANENLARLIQYGEGDYDGAIVLKPFACNPETIIEPAIEKISKDYDMPIACLSIDESTLETHFQTRIESFVDMLKMRKGIY